MSCKTSNLVQNATIVVIRIMLIGFGQRQMLVQPSSSESANPRNGCGLACCLLSNSLWVYAATKNLPFPNLAVKVGFTPMLKRGLFGQNFGRVTVPANWNPGHSFTSRGERDCPEGLFLGMLRCLSFVLDCHG